MLATTNNSVERGVGGIQQQKSFDIKDLRGLFPHKAGLQRRVNGKFLTDSFDGTPIRGIYVFYLVYGRPFRVIDFGDTIIIDPIDPGDWNYKPPRFQSEVWDDFRSYKEDDERFQYFPPGYPPFPGSLGNVLWLTNPEWPAATGEVIYMPCFAYGDFSGGSGGGPGGWGGGGSGGPGGPGPGGNGGNPLPYPPSLHKKLSIRNTWYDYGGIYDVRYGIVYYSYRDNTTGNDMTITLTSPMMNVNGVAYMGYDGDVWEITRLPDVVELAQHHHTVFNIQQGSFGVVVSYL